MAAYREIEDKILKVIVGAVDLPLDEPEEIKRMDAIVLRTEARDLNLISPAWKHYLLVPLPQTIIPLSPVEAERKFIKRYLELTEWRHE